MGYFGVPWVPFHVVTSLHLFSVALIPGDLCEHQLEYFRRDLFKPVRDFGDCLWALGGPVRVYGGPLGGGGLGDSPLSSQNGGGGFCSWPPFPLCAPSECAQVFGCFT